MSNKISSTQKIKIILWMSGWMVLVFSHQAAADCISCAKIEKQETVLLSDLEIYNSARTDSSRKDATTQRLKDSAHAAIEISAALTANPPNSETLIRLTEFLVKIDEIDTDRVVLDGIYDTIKTHLAEIKKDASTLLKNKKVTKTSYESFTVSLAYVEDEKKSKSAN